MSRDEHKKNFVQWSTDKKFKRIFSESLQLNGLYNPNTQGFILEDGVIYHKTEIEYLGKEETTKDIIKNIHLIKKVFHGKITS